jgi:MYXO-CTERM domain-containing protein
MLRCGAVRVSLQRFGMFMSRIVLGSLVVASGFGFSTSAAAHIRLSEPLARYEITGSDNGIKGCPCGLATGGGNSNRTCNVELDGSDPARDDERASTFPAGSTIKLKFEEYVGHAGRYRVAFDQDGADFEDFNANVIHDETDPNGNEGNIGDGSKWEIEVTLPNMECDNCTLQLLQVMAGGTENPVDGSKLATLSTYYACIDLTLTAAEGSTDDESSDTSSEGGTSSAETSSSQASDTTATSTAATTSGGQQTSTASESGGSDEPGEVTSNDEASSSFRPTDVAPPRPSSNAGTSTSPSAPTTTVGASTAATATTATSSAPPSDEPLDDGGEEGGCSVAVSQQPSDITLGAFGAAVVGMLVRRRRRTV